uniref:Uncharacterized protein n=1 Tax=Anguilla anguilla TaxID=7936 RepID=A0A0E9TJC7_ANGAN
MISNHSFAIIFC